MLGFNAALSGVPAARKSVHICFSDYDALWPAVLDLEDCLELQLEFANRDSRELGTRDEDRPGYAQTRSVSSGSTGTPVSASESSTSTPTSSSRQSSCATASSTPSTRSATPAASR